MQLCNFLGGSITSAVLVMSMWVVIFDRVVVVIVAEATSTSLDFAPSVIANSEMFVNVSGGLDTFVLLRIKILVIILIICLLKSFKKLDVKKIGATWWY